MSTAAPKVSSTPSTFVRGYQALYSQPHNIFRWTRKSLRSYYPSKFPWIADSKVTRLAKPTERVQRVLHSVCTSHIILNLRKASAGESGLGIDGGAEAARAYISTLRFGLNRALHRGRDKPKVETELEDDYTLAGSTTFKGDNWASDTYVYTDGTAMTETLEMHWMRFLSAERERILYYSRRWIYTPISLFSFCLRPHRFYIMVIMCFMVVMFWTIIYSLYM